MKVLIRPSSVPPGGFRYIDPDTKRLHQANSLQSVTKLAEAHRKANKLPIPDNYSDVIMDWMCSQVPEGICMEKSDIGKPVFPSPGGPPKMMMQPVRSLVRTLDQVQRGTQVIFNAWKKLKSGKSPFVDQKEAERRGAICVQCPNNQPSEACIGCRGLYTWMQSIIGRRGTAHDPKLLVCSVCSCLNRAQIHFELDVLHSAVTPEMNAQFPDQFTGIKDNQTHACWKKKKTVEPADGLRVEVEPTTQGDSFT